MAKKFEISPDEVKTKTDSTEEKGRSETA